MELKTHYPLITACVPGEIGEYLKKHGAEVFPVGTDPFEKPEKSAELLINRIERVLEKTGAEKLSIISHGLSGLAARAAAVRLGDTGKIASVTTVCTPHRGLRTADELMNARIKKLSSAYIAYDNWTKLSGANSPQLYDVVCRLGTDEMRAFNLLNPDVKGVFYQSAVCAMAPADDSRFRSACNILSVYDGENDGFASVYSAMWGQYCRIYRGVSHLSLSPEIYADAVRQLIERGL